MNAINKMISDFKVVVDDKVCLTKAGDIAVHHPKNNTFTTVLDGKLIDLNEKDIINVPGVIVRVLFSTVKVGDIVFTGSADSKTHTYTKITAIDGNKLTGITFGGNIKSIVATFDDTTNLTTVAVVKSIIDTSVDVNTISDLGNCDMTLINAMRSVVALGGDLFSVLK